MTAGWQRALLAVVLAAAGCRGPTPSSEGAVCTHLQAGRPVGGVALCEDAWTCIRPPKGPFDRIGIHRLAACEHASGPIVLYLPGMHMTGDLTVTDMRHDLRLYLATHNVRVWSLDYRTHAVPADASAADLTALSAWNADVFTNDAAWAAGFVRGIDQGPLYVAGFSFGAGLAYRLAARSGDRPAGLVILDGAAGSATPPPAGADAIDVGSERLPYAQRQRLLDAVIANPEGPSPIPGYPTAGAALSEILYTSQRFGGKGGLADPYNVSDVQVLASLLRRYDRWWPRAALATAPPATPARPLPVLALVTTNMGPQWVARARASAEGFGGPQTDVRELQGWGHLDVFASRNAARAVFEPVRQWLTEHPTR